MTRVTRYKPIRYYRRINKAVICRTSKLTEMQIEARRRFHIQLKANYSRIRKNVIIKNIDYRKERERIARLSRVVSYICSLGNELIKSEKRGVAANFTYICSHPPLVIRLIIWKRCKG